MSDPLCYEGDKSGPVRRNELEKQIVFSVQLDDRPSFERKSRVNSAEKGPDLRPTQPIRPVLTPVEAENGAARIRFAAPSVPP